MIENILDRVSGRVPAGCKRDPRWSGVQKAFLLRNPACAVCGARKGLNVHHIVPFHVDPSKELLESNLITLCRVHHEWWGHLGDWKSYNVDIIKDALAWNEKIKNRPGGKIGL